MDNKIAIEAKNSFLVWRLKIFFSSKMAKKWPPIGRKSIFCPKIWKFCFYTPNQNKLIPEATGRFVVEKKHNLTFRPKWAKVILWSKNWHLLFWDKIQINSTPWSHILYFGQKIKSSVFRPKIGPKGQKSILGQNIGILHFRPKIIKISL